MPRREDVEMETVPTVERHTHMLGLGENTMSSTMSSVNDDAANAEGDLLDVLSLAEPRGIS